jgi:GPH family glycoside/pentoside/hexuronide:cation symporter
MYLLEMETDNKSTQINKEKNVKLKLSSKIIYGTGSIAENTMQNGIQVMMNPFFNVALGVTPALLGLATAIFRIWDAITDPFMGMLSDRTVSSYGRRRPYILLGAIMSGILFAVMWWCPRGMTTTFYFGWFLIVSILFYSFYTVFCVPYLALGYEMSTDYHERTSVMSFRTWFAAISGIGVQWLFWITQRSVFVDTVDGMRWVGIGLGFIIILMGIMPGLFLKERTLTKDEIAQNRLLVKPKGLFKALDIKSFRYILYALTFVVAGMFLVITLGFYLNVYYVFKGDLKAASTMIGVSGMLYHLMSMIALPVINKLSLKLGKKKALLIFIVIAIVGNILKWWCFTPENPWLQLIAIGLIGPGLAAIWTLLASMTADVTDLDELENGTRREGLFGALYNWTMKLGFALCFLIGSLILELTGFDATIVGPQSDYTLYLIRLLYTIVPTFGLLISMYFIWQFPITEKISMEIREKLNLQSLIKQ